MSERALRGSRLGTTSYETDLGVDVAPRELVAYECPKGHRIEIPFSVEAEIPSTWDCRTCGQTAVRLDTAAPDDKPIKPARTHWDMLLERRSREELEEILAERLALLRSGELGTRSHRKSA